MSLVSMLRRYDRKLKNYYKEQMKSGSKSVAAVWVCDNYALCSLPLKAAAGSLSSQGEKGLMSLFLLCKEYFSSGETVDEKRIAARLSSEELNVLQSHALRYLLPAAASAVLCESVYSEDDELAVKCVKNLLKLREIDFEYILYESCKIERMLWDDPTDEYRKMNSSTRRIYREAVMRGAKKEKASEINFLEKSLDKAKRDDRHIGFFLPINPLKTKLAVLFIVLEWVLSATLSLAAAVFLCGNILYSMLFILPLYAVIKPFSERLSARLFPVRPMPSMGNEYAEGADVLITVSTLLPDAGNVKKLYSHLSQLYSANAPGSVRVLLLADRKNSKNPENACDDADSQAVKRLVDDLNENHGGGFLVAVRDRVYSPSEEEYTGFERKRGAISALVRYLRDGESGEFSFVYGDTAGLSDMKYLMALDSDTELSFDVIKKLLCYARHPLNRPVFDNMKKRVVSGYGIFAPRVETSVESAGKTAFSGVFTSGGSLAYAPFVSERYMDMFQSSIFCGKGLIDIDMFYASCTDKFDTGRILSHDILEGAVMRTAFVPDCELSDEFPSTAEGYFSRLHRWIRGDVQNVKYIFFPLGKSGSSPSVPSLGKYQLADNLRRAITPINIFILLAVSLFLPYSAMSAFLYIGIAAVISEHLCSLLFTVIRNGLRSFSSLYFSSSLTVVQRDIMRMIFSLGSYPQYAFVCFDAVIKSAWRSLISHKKLLNWQTAADADSAKRSNRLSGVIFPLIVAIVLFLTGTAVHRLISLFIPAFIVLASEKGKGQDKRKSAELSENERHIIFSFAAAAWRFFSENVTVYGNYLPPDNVQETPVPRTAYRTSPTNIGFYLVSILACADMSVISVDEAVRRLDETLLSVEKLPKYKGLLYNWYDTVKMVPLEPCYVSSVDCGNYLVCLTALYEGLKEYENLHPLVKELSARIKRLIDEGDISILYDKNRDLFRIGIDGSTGEASLSFYDLYMSEARMTSYYACAKRIVPSSHWQTLGRMLKRSGPYVGAVSWTGTAFEYFMPILFLENVPGTFQYEALKVCLYQQKKFCKKHSVPYGISESGFYAVDPSLNYSYKAHGIKKLALKRDADEERVISPYSVFLTLPFDKDAAMKNLSALSALHCEGRCGFYEAVDFSPERTDGEDYAIVRSYMSHHVGMSIIAMANTLSDNIFVKRFMSDDNMNAAKLLLREKLPVHPLVTRSAEERIVKQEKILRKNPEVRSAPEEGKESFAYSNGEMTLFCDKYGRNRCVFAGRELYKYSSSSKGISVAVETEEGLSPLFPSSENTIKLKKYAMYADKKAVSCAVGALSVHPSLNALLVPVKIDNDSDTALKCRLHFYLEPSLLPFLKSDPHPAFSDMFLNVNEDRKNRHITFFRPKDEASPAISIGFYGKNRFLYSLDREKLLQRKKDRRSVFDDGYSFCEENTRGVSPVCALCIDAEVSPGKSREYVLVIAAGSNSRQAVHSLMRVRDTALPLLSSGAAATFLRDKLTFSGVCSFISRICFEGASGEISAGARASLMCGKSALWKVGISGDRPIITVFADKNCPPLLQRAYVRLFRRLAKCSVPSDMVFIFSESGEYGFSGERDLRSIIEEEGVGDFLGGNNGLYIFNLPSLPDDSFRAIAAFSELIYPEPQNDSQVNMGFLPKLTETFPLYDTENGFISDGFAVNRHPLLPWCHTLSNNTFGTLLSDRSLGYTWAMNSRQNKLTPWSNDTAGDLKGERMLLVSDGRVYDLTDNASVIFSPSYAQFSCRAGDIVCTVKAEIPEKGMRKRISISLTNKGNSPFNGYLLFCAFPVMGESDDMEKFVNIKTSEGFVTAENPLNEDFRGVLFLRSSDENAVYLDKAPDGEGGEQRAMAILQKIALDVNGRYLSSIDMTFGKTAYSAEKAAHLPFLSKKNTSVSVKTGFDSLDEFASALLYHQVSDTRLRARCGFYQCSGAFGFRDQLQDVLSLIGRENRKVRQMIYKAASAQFYEGDVLHWFHPVYDGSLIYRGVRTRCSDDMLWLPFTVAQYVLKTGDTSILGKKIPFLEGESLSEAQTENYGEYRHGKRSASLYTHCIYALTKQIRTGQHSLPLIGNGDWNDSFNMVGSDGKGESVWLALFCRTVFLNFAKICDLMNESALSEALKSSADSLARAVDGSAWNGKWYVRGFYDDGSVLGDENSDACRIDLLCQAWASLCDMPDRERVRQALLSAYEKLFDEKNGIVKLFTPPFTVNSKKTGYVNYYPPGMRENGGQYTHAAVWFLAALIKEGLDRQAEKLLLHLLPGEKYKNGKGDAYKTEPYAMAGDVYSAPGHEGRGGWSLYTGSAGWLQLLADALSSGEREII